MRFEIQVRVRVCWKLRIRELTQQLFDVFWESFKWDMSWCESSACLMWNLMLPILTICDLWVFSTHSHPYTYTHIHADVRRTYIHTFTHVRMQARRHVCTHYSYMHSLTKIRIRTLFESPLRDPIMRPRGRLACRSGYQYSPKWAL